MSKQSTCVLSKAGHFQDSLFSGQERKQQITQQVGISKEKLKFSWSSIGTSPSGQALVQSASCSGVISVRNREMCWNKSKSKRKEGTEVAHYLCQDCDKSCPECFQPFPFLKTNWVSISWNCLQVSVNNICFPSSPSSSFHLQNWKPTS